VEESGRLKFEAGSRCVLLLSISKIRRGDPLARLAEFTLSSFAALRAVRSGMANGLATLCPQRLIFTHIFRWTPGLTLEVLVLPWLPSLVSGHG
jgi:hypothetical protein